MIRSAAFRMVVLPSTICPSLLKGKSLYRNIRAVLPLVDHGEIDAAGELRYALSQLEEVA
jgi:hypothetical protein